MHENKCDTPRVMVIKKILAYFDTHYMQASMLFGALSIGFMIFVGCVGYAVILQAQGGCLTFLTKYVTENNNNL